jgi:hypothetical protein
MGNTAPGDHPVQLARADRLISPGAIPVMEVALKEVRDGAETDMRVRPNVDALSGQELGRPSLIEEDERPDHLPLWRRQGTTDLKAAEIARAWNNECFDRVEANLIGTARVHCRIPTHAPLPLLGLSGGLALAHTNAQTGQRPSAQLALQCVKLCRSKWNVRAAASSSAVRSRATVECSASISLRPFMF